jgi:pimeloyl-ACP methyl ester carboxylesterase
MGNLGSVGGGGAAAAAGPEQRRPSYLTMLSQGYDQLVNAIIRPPRAECTADHLGPASFAFRGRQFARRDLKLVNPRGHNLECCWWKRVDAAAGAAGPKPCVIYLHGNAACRAAAIALLDHLLPLGVSVFALDFSGSGASDGDYVSLGFFEREDVAAVIAHLRASGEVSTIGLWGHSMGAATAIMYADRDPSIAAMVCDSPFADLQQLANELVVRGQEMGIRVPGVAVSLAMSAIRRTVRRTAAFDPKDVSPIANVASAFVPALFAHGERDAFIAPHHSEQIHAAYAGDKNLIIFDGDHNSRRPQFLFDSASIFLRQTLMVDDADMLRRGEASVVESWRTSESVRMQRRAEDEMMRRALMFSAVGGRGARALPTAVPATSPIAGETLVTAEWAEDAPAGRNSSSSSASSAAPAPAPASATASAAAEASATAQRRGSAQPAVTAAHFAEFDDALREDAELRQAIALSLAEEERAAAARAGSSGAEL